MTRTRFRFDTVVGRVIYFVYRFVENNNTSNSSSSSLTQPLECAWYIFYEWIRIERKGTTSWLGWSTQRLPNFFCRPRSPQEPQTRSRPAYLADLHGTIPSRVGEPSSRFYFLVLSRPRHDNPSFLLGLQYTSIFSVNLVAGGRHTVYEQTYPF